MYVQNNSGHVWARSVLCGKGRRPVWYDIGGIRPPRLCLGGTVRGICGHFGEATSLLKKRLGGKGSLLYVTVKRLLVVRSLLGLPL